MRRMRYTNAKPVLKSEYVHCGKKRNMPRMSRIVCEKNCSEYKPGEYVECPHYNDWYYKYYEKELEVEVPKPKKKGRKKKDAN